MSTNRFSDRLAKLVEERRSQVVLGLDPDPASLWPSAVGRAGRRVGELAVRSGSRSTSGDPAELTAAAVAEHCAAAITATADACVAVKLQLACFERLGANGWRALEQTVEAAHEAGLLVIADGKRGDVPVTARAYGQALVGEVSGPFGEVPGLGADAFTANPLLGRDSLAPLLEAAAAAGAGCFCLVRTSNPGAAEVQDEPGPGGVPLHELLAGLVDELGQEAVGDAGLSDVGAVVAATRPDLLERMRELMPKAVLLCPGVGAQGGEAEALGPAFSPHPAAAIVPSSRSIVDAHRETGEDPATAAAAAAERLRSALWRLAS